MSIIERIAAHIPLQPRIYAGYLLMGALSLLIIVSSALGLERIAREFAHFSQSGQQAQDGLLLAKDIIEIQLTAQRFTYEGDPFSAERVEQGHARIRTRLTAYRQTLDTGHAARIDTIMNHLDHYDAAFDQVQRQRERQSTLIDHVLPDHARRAEALAQDYATLASGTESNAWELLSVILRIEQYSERYFDTLDHRHIEQARAEIERVRAMIALLAGQADPRYRDMLGEILTTAERYEQILLEAIQRTRGYLYLTNVVMAAEAQEIIHQSRRISESIRAEMDASTEQIETTITRTTRTALLAAALLLTFYVLLSYLIGQSIARPILQLATLFKRLSEGSEDMHIPVGYLHDELGELTRAAQVFRYKNAETRSLLMRYQHLSEQLEAKVEERTRALEQSNLQLRDAKEAAEEGARIKSDFLANMSHEIRTPINAITGMTHVLLQTELSEPQHHSVELIGQSSRALLALVNDILDLSKIEAGKLQIETVEFDLYQVVESAVAMISMRALDQGLELSVHYGGEVGQHYRGDPLRLGQILTNLLSNAIKFTSDGAIGIDIEQAADGWLSIEVWDTGIGMSAGQQLHLFEAFTQADTSTTRKYGGTGLGLAITKHLVSLMHGSIEVDSCLNAGARFRVRLALLRQMEARAPSAELQGRHVLVIEPSARWRTILDTQLSGLGLGMSLCANLDGARTALESGQDVDLLLFDADSISAEGLAAVRAQHTALPVVAMSAQCLTGSRSAPEALSGICCLGKPFNPVTLGNVLARALGLATELPGLQHDDRAELQRQLATRQGRRVLIVDDYAVNREVIRKMLAKSGLLMEDAEHGLAALSAIEQSPGRYDLVLMDVQMPEMDGYTATRHIRALAPGLPIVALSASAMVADVERSRQHGMDAHISKPIDLEQLLRTLIELIPPGIQAAPGSQPHPVPAPPEPQHSLPSSAHISLADGLRRLDGDLDFYLELLQQFAEDHRHSPQTLRHEARTNLEQAGALAHRLKGTGANLGIKELHRLAEVAQTSPVVETLDALASELTLVLEEIDALSVASGASHAPLPMTAVVLSAQERRSLLRELIATVRERRPRPICILLDRIRRIELAPHEATLIDEVEPLLRRYDYQKALRLLEAGDVDVQPAGTQDHPRHR